MASGWDLVYDEALRANREQQQALDALRSRTTLLVAAAAAAGAVFSRPHPPDGARLVVWWAIVTVAAGAAVAALFFAVLVLRPQKGWRWRQEMDDLIAKAATGCDADEMKQGMAPVFAADWKHNDAKMNRLHWLFLCGIVAVAVEYVLLLIAQGVAS